MSRRTGRLGFERSTSRHHRKQGKRKRTGRSTWQTSMASEVLEARQLLAGDLVAHWVADESLVTDGSGVVTQWTDSIGGVLAASEGSPRFADGVLGGRAAVTFDVSDGGDGFRVRAADNPLSNVNDFSVAVTFVTDSNALEGNGGTWYDNTGLVDSNSLGFSTGWGVTIAQDGRPLTGMGDGFGVPSTTLESSVTGLNDGQLHTVVVSRSGSTMSLYVDDQAVDSRSDMSSKLRSPLDLTFGMLQHGVKHFDGQIAQVRVYNGALDAAEVNQLVSTIDTYYDNSAPVSADDQYQLDEDNAFFFIQPASGVLANDVDADGDALTAVLVEGPQHGTLSLQPTGAFLYAPDTNYYGTDSFTYTANDFRPGNVATVTLEVRPVYDPPQAVADQYKAIPTEVLQVPSLVGVLGNDFNPDNATMTAVLEQAVGNGSLTLNADGSFTYSPNGFSGQTSFSYRVSDGTSLSAPATVTLIVNTAPQAVADEYQVDEDNVLTVNVGQGVLANDNDADGNAMTVRLESEPNSGTLELQADGSFVYEPNAEFSGEDRFEYSLSDGVDESGTVAVRLIVNSVNDPPISQTDAYLTSGSLLEVSAADGVLANDTDIDNASLTAVLVDAPTQGTLNLNADGSFTYQSPAGFSGQDRFTYVASDGTAATSPTEVIIVGKSSSVNPSDPTGDSVVTFNELMYNPTSSQTTREWIELHNQMGINMDISGWSLTGGIYYEFAEGTVIPGNGFLIVASNPEVFEAEYGVSGAVGPFAGRLSNGGEELILRNNSDRIMDIMDYADGGEWPVGPDGSGATLSKVYGHRSSEKPENWVTSLQLGGTPGAENFPEFDPTPVATTLATWSTAWQIQDQAQFGNGDWTQVGFDDSAWRASSGLWVAGNPEFPPANAAQPVEPGVGLYGYWPLDEGTGSVAGNLVNGGAEGTLVSNPGWRTDATRGDVLNFDGRNDHVVAGTIPALAVDDDFTWSVWYKQDDADNANAVIIGNRSGGQAAPLQFVKLTPNNFEYYSGQGDPNLPYAMPNDQWLHLAVVKDGPSFTYYVNGEEVGEGTTNHDTAENPFYFGGDPNAANEFADGLLDDVALWTRALPREAIVGLADGTYTPLTAPTALSTGPVVPDDLPEERTQLDSSFMTSYGRLEFDVVDPGTEAFLTIEHLVADGAVYYLNGQEIYRQNMPAGPVSATTPSSSDVTAIGLTGPIVVPADALVSGTNVLAVEIHRSSSQDPDGFYGAQVSLSIAPNDTSNLALPQLNEISAGDDPALQVELFNPHDEAIDLAGYRLGEYTFPPVTLQPGGYTTVTREQVGAGVEEGDELFLIAPNGRWIADAQRVADRLVGRDHGLDGRWFFPTQATFGAANVFDINQDVVINEIMYHAPGLYVPQLDELFDNEEEWIELYNRSATNTVDLSGWEFDGIEYRIPDGTSLGPNQYLVISNNPASLMANHEGLDESNVLGPFGRRLSNGGENIQLLDSNLNLVDEVHYYDGGRWDGNADGYASSLELVNPFADNGKGEAWAASDESDQATWQTLTFRGSGRNISNGPTQYNEFLLGLLDDGEVLIDDVVVIESPGTPDAVQLIQNGTFEGDAVGESPAAWRIIGTQHGEVTIDPADPSNKVLRLTSGGSTEHMHNNAGTTLKDGDTYPRLSNSREYEIQFRARWVSGSNQLNSRLYFNRLQATTRLNRPMYVGTPGAVNSQYREEVGPTFDGLIHSPAVPDAMQPVTVSVAASDPQGIAAMELWYSVDAAPFVSVAMTAAEEGLYQGTIPGQAAGSLIQFYVLGTDTGGTTAMQPADGPESRALYRVQDGEANSDARHTLRILMTPDDTDFLHESTNVMSNDRLGATVIYRESEIYYDVGVRLKGSQRGRDKVVRAGFNIGFAPDHLFRDVHSTIGVDRSGSGDEYSQEEIIVRQILNHAGNGPQIYDDLIHVIAPDPRHTGSAMLNMARYNDVYLDSQYENGSQGTAFEYELIYYPTSTVGGVEGLKRPNPDSVVGVGVAGLGDDKEAYRWNFIIENNRRGDDYSQIMEFLNVFGQRSSTEGYQEQIAEVMDVDQWLRSFAVQRLAGIGDSYSAGAQHNGIFYVRPSDDKVLYLPWDMDFSFTEGATSSLIASGDHRKLMDSPANERAYYGHVLDIVNTTFNREYMDPWIDHFDELVPAQAHFQSFKSYIGSRASYALGRIDAAIPPVEFAITTPAGLDVGDATTATVEGTGWVDVRELRLAGTNVPLQVEWPTTSNWQAKVPVQNGTQDVTIEAYGFHGELIGSQTVSVTSSGQDLVRESLRVTEISFNPRDFGAGEATVDNDDFEFIEVQNIGNVPIDLDGVQFVQVEVEGEQAGIRFVFDAQVLQPGESRVVVKNTEAFRSRFGSTDVIALGQDGAAPANTFGGRLSNGGEMITLVDAAGAIIQQFTYDDAWYDETDGEGNTLELLDASNPDLSSWNLRSSWRASLIPDGSPGHITARAGDANFDGVFNSSDLVLVFQLGEYEDGIAGNSTWGEGDWNGDGDFTTRDLVAAFVVGDYEPDEPANAKKPLNELAVDRVFSRLF